jgi:hypothetical protein
MKNTWRILGAVVALALAACTEENGGDGGGGGTTTGTCTGTFSGAITGTVRSCTVEATKFANNNEIDFTIEITPATGSGTLKSVDNLIITLTGDVKTGTFTGATLKNATGSVFSTDADKQYDVQLGFGGDIGTASLTLDAVPAPTNTGGNLNYQGFSGSTQVKFDAPPTADYTGSVNLSLTFKR